MGQRYIECLETEIAVLEDTLDGVDSDMVRLSLTTMIASLQQSLWLEPHPQHVYAQLAPPPPPGYEPDAYTVTDGTLQEETIDWF